MKKIAYALWANRIVTPKGHAIKPKIKIYTQDEGPAIGYTCR